MNWVALDIGGANLKAADGRSFAVTQPFPLWQRPSHLAEALRALLAAARGCDHVAATMTGELADCFRTKAEGVQFIIGALESAADSRHTRVYLTSGALVTPRVALKQPLLAAASNWHALARFAGRWARSGVGLLIDIGSTTCDIIPLVDGKPVSMGRTDTKRLASGELVYTGIERSPVCALVRSVPYRGRKCPVAQELFATTWDVYLLLGDLPEEPECAHTADRRPATKQFARERLARMICADSATFSDADALAVARHVANMQLARVAVAAAHVINRLNAVPETVVLSGRGEFLARRALAKLQLAPRIVSLAEELGPDLSRCAAAHALAVLAREGG